MDFDFSPEADEAAGLAAQILKDRATPERMRAVEADGDRFDHELWQHLADAGLVGLAIPESYGGAGLGLVEALRVVVEVGPHRRTRAGRDPRSPARSPSPSSAPTTSASCGCTPPRRASESWRPPSPRT